MTPRMTPKALQMLEFEVIVSFSARAGSIFHDPLRTCVGYGERMTLEDAKNRGYRPCKKCFI